MAAGAARLSERRPCFSLGTGLTRPRRPAAWACVPVPLCSRHMWPRAPLLRCQRGQTRFLDPARSADPEHAPSWNVAPTDPFPVVRYDARAGERSLDGMRWGLVPFWPKDIKVGFANINGKAEGIESKLAFREGFQRRSCLVPVDVFYERKQTGTGKQPQ
jgi:SOS response associated peptidase (SRAP)